MLLLLFIGGIPAALIDYRACLTVTDALAFTLTVSDKDACDA